MAFSSCLNKNVATVLVEVTEMFALPDSPIASTPEQFNALLRTLIPARGQRFPHDFHNTCLYMARSKNANVVAYTTKLKLHAGPAATPSKKNSTKEKAQSENSSGNTAAESKNVLNSNATYYPLPTVGKGPPVLSGKGAACDLLADNPIHVYFINLEPSYLEDRRRKGLDCDCDDLNLLERRLAYGYNHKVLDCQYHLSTKVTKLLSSKSYPKFFSLTEDMMIGVANWWSAFSPVVIQFVAAKELPCVLLRLSPIAKDASPPASLPWDGSCSAFAVEDTVSVLLSRLDGELCILDHTYINSVERRMLLPKVLYVEFFGVSLISGKTFSTKMAPDGSKFIP